MGVFKKLKDVLFDIEEEEIPVITKDEKQPIVDKNPIKEVKMPIEKPVVEDIIPEEKETRIENKFNFPLDIEDDMPVRSHSIDYIDDEFVGSRSSFREKENIYSESNSKNKDDYSYDYRRLNTNDKKKTENKQFKISPIISPVYGILDQNYTKDDVIVRSETNKSPNLDEVRKKAYGSKKTKVEEREKDEFEEPLKTLDEILIDNQDDKKKKEEQIETIFEEEIKDSPIYDDELPDEPYADEIPEEAEEKEETIESDLFNLIDSMYEEKNKREEE